MSNYDIRDTWIWKVQPYATGVAAITGILVFVLAIVRLTQHRWVWAVIDLVLAAWNFWVVRLNLRIRNDIKRRREY